MVTYSKRDYRRFRDLGYTAQYAIRAAKIIYQFRELESDELVRLIAQQETEDYFSVYGRENISKQEDKHIQELIDTWGCWHIRSEYRNKNDQWQRADSIGMCIYKDPKDAFDNVYIIDLMQSAIEYVQLPEYVI
jgi:DNA primase large subunit